MNPTIEELTEAVERECAVAVPRHCGGELWQGRRLTCRIKIREPSRAAEGAQRQLSRDMGLQVRLRKVEYRAGR